MNKSKAQLASAPTKSRVQHGVSQDPGLALTALACEYSSNNSPKSTVEIALANASKNAPKLVISASPEDTISHLLDAIFAHTGILPDHQHLELDGKALDPSKTLQDSGVGKDAHELLLNVTTPQASASFAPSSSYQPGSPLKSTVQLGSDAQVRFGPLPVSAQPSSAQSLGQVTNIAESSTSLSTDNRPVTPEWLSESSSATKQSMNYKSRGARARSVSPNSPMDRPVVGTSRVSSPSPDPSERQQSLFSEIGSIFRRGSAKGRSPRRPVLTKQSEAEKLGLFPRAHAKVLKEWDGIIPTLPGQKGVIPKGLKLHLDRPVTIGRVVNPDWYQGYDPHDHVGYFPRNHVEVTDVQDPGIIPELGADAPVSKTPGIPTSRPSTPPSPFPGTPGSNSDYDFSQTRVTVVYTVTPATKSPFPISITLTVAAKPNTRISSMTFRTTLPDGQILELKPVSISSDGTQIHHTDSHNTEAGVNIGTPATLPAQGGATWKDTGTKGEDYQRTTWGRIEGVGKGFNVATWVFEEDPGKGGRHGVPILKTTQELSLNLDVRQVMCEYEVEVTVVEGDGTKPGFFNSSTHKSGKQKVFLP